jgi:hypothetical protein
LNRVQAVLVFQTQIEQAQFEVGVLRSQCQCFGDRAGFQAADTSADGRQQHPQPRTKQGVIVND